MKRKIAAVAAAVALVAGGMMWASPAMADDTAPPGEAVVQTEEVTAPEEAVAEPAPEETAPDQGQVADPQPETEPVVEQPAAPVAEPAPVTETVTTQGGYEHPKEHKYYVCKYVGTPGVDERLQTGQNPIFTDEHSIASYPNIVIGDFFKDGQYRSVVIAGPYEKKVYPEPTVADCPPHAPDEVTPTLSWTPPTCDEDGVLTLGEGNWTWSAVLNDDGSTTYTATAGEGAIIPEGTQFQWTVPNLDRLPEDSDECYNPPPVSVVPEVPAPVDECGVDNDTFTLPENSDSIEYSFGENGSVVAVIVDDSVWGELPEGWVMESDTVAVYAHDSYPFSEEPCDTVVTLGQPRVEDACGTENDWAFIPDDTEAVDYFWASDDPSDFDFYAQVKIGYTVLDPGEGWVFDGMDETGQYWLYKWNPVFTDVPCDETATLDGSFITPTCISDAAYLQGLISLSDPDDQVPDDATATISMTDGVHTFTYPQQFPLGNVSVLWPGASVGPDGHGITWPGYITNADGTYTATDDPAYYGWTRGGVTVTVEVNPEFSTTVDYPPSSPLCLTSPPTPPAPPALASTGGGDVSPLVPLAGGIASALGGVLVLMGWLRRRSA